MPKLKNIEFDLILPEANLTKLRLHRDNLDVEGIWISVSNETKNLIEQNTTGVEFVARLANHALHFYPNPSWGLHLLCKTNGDKKSECDLNWVDYSQKENRIWGEDIENKL